MATENYSAAALVVTDQPYFTEYVGTKEQLISLGIAKDSQFPEGKKRVKGSYWDGWRARKIKGGKFLFHVHHPYRAPKEPKGAEYSSPAAFKDSLAYMADFASIFLDGVISKARGEEEHYKHGEITIRLDDQSIEAIVLAKARFVNAVRAAKVVVESKPAARLVLVK